MRTHLPLALIASALALACGSPSTPAVDAAAPDAAVATDATTVDAAPPTFVLFAPCRTAADCNGGADTICNDAFPGGMCTVPCTTDADCGDDACWRGACRPTCTEGGFECARWQGACARDPAARARCTMACDSFEPLPAGVLACNDGLACSPAAGNCVAPALLPTGAENGSPCTVDTDCRGGVCLAEIDASGEPSGYLGGLCVSLGVHPPDSAFVTGAPSPRSNCVEGSIILRADGASPGDVTICFPECDDSTECRPGYACVYGDGAATSPVPSTGACWPVFCDIPEMDCPTGTTCVVRGGLSRCVTT